MDDDSFLFKLKIDNLDKSLKEKKDKTCDGFEKTINREFYESRCSFNITMIN